VRGRLVVVGVPGDRRIAALGRAIERCGLPPAIVIPWRDAIETPAIVGHAGAPGDRLRVESPGADLDTWHRLARAGGSTITIGDTQWRPGRAWFRGLAHVMQAIEAAAPHLVATHPASDVLAMTDKLECAARLHSRGVPTPETMEAPTTPAALREMLAATDRHAVFVKARWGSSGAGVSGLRRAGSSSRRAGSSSRRAGPGERLTTTGRIVDGVLVNYKALRHHDDRETIDRLLAPVLADGAVVQRWIPKAGTHGGPFDLRVLVVRGRIAHKVARVGRGTITNLHLDATRIDADLALARFGQATIAAVEAACRLAASCFSPCATVGVDVMIDPRGRPFVLECNAWGDYLPRLLCEGLDSYEVQLTGERRGA
jgi:glutathione synthase/RimK-type ligase-like ATP-grasp enzyme